VKNLHLFLIATALISIMAGFGCTLPTAEEKAQQEKILKAMPFDIIIGGNNARLNSEFCAKIPAPVKTNAEVLINVKSNDIIVVSITPSTPEGIVKAGKKPFILLVENDGKSALNKIRNGKKLKPGFYLMNINANNQIASVVFEIIK